MNKENQEKDQKNQKQNKKNAIIEVLNSPFSIIIVLIMLVICLLVYIKYMSKSTTLYTFSAFLQDVSVLNGTIYTSRDVNSFGDSKIIYTGKDEKIYDFVIGYYIKSGDGYRSIVEREGREDLKDGASLKEILEKSDLSFTEGHKEAKYLSKENIEELNNLVFRVVGKDVKGEEYVFEVPISVEKVTK